MGEHTIREILRRRSPDTQRAMKRRRELAGVTGGGALMPTLLILAVILAILGYTGYLGWVARGAGQRFAAAEAAHPHELALAGTTEFLPNTLLASLDPKFYNSTTLDGATLTHRLLKLYYPDASGMDLRVMSVSVEAQYPKTDIMESFINQVPMGDASHPIKGFAAASKFYFGKPFAELAPQDIALLVALIKDPVGLDPRNSPEKAFDARNLVLQSDLQQNVLSQAQVDNLTKMPLDVVPLPAPQAPAPK
ncbi:MAG TPA: transglycosylase domain-containing protein [Gammaproteobacteria bacterium]|jgi:hypothetical protein